MYWAGEGRGTAGWLEEPVAAPKKQQQQVEPIPTDGSLSLGEEGAGSAEGSSCGDRKVGQTAKSREGSKNQNLRGWPRPCLVF